MVGINNSYAAGFVVQVHHPHPHVVKCMQFLRGKRESEEGGKAGGREEE